MRISDWSSDVCSSDLVASEADTVSFGHLATDEDEFTGGTYGSDLQRRLVNVADGIGDHDAATMGQLGSVVAALGGGASFSGGVFGAPTYVIQGSSYDNVRSEEHTSELQSLMRISYAVFCLKKKNKTQSIILTHNTSQQRRYTQSDTVS